jgi:hypothetical protein
VSKQKPEFAWAQLRELRLPWGRYSATDFLEILHNASHLEMCTISIIRSQDPLCHPVVRNDNLRELNIYDCDDLAPLFESLALPALRNLSCEYFYLWPRDEFLSLIHRSSCTLQKLVLLATSFDGGHSIAECLRFTSNLLELELLEGSCTAITGDFFRDMALHSSPPCLLPKLQRLKVSRDISFDYNAFAAMVESRWRVNPSHGTTHVAVERMQRVEVCLIEGYEVNGDYLLYDVDEYSESFALLRQLRVEGLDVISPDIEP